MELASRFSDDLGHSRFRVRRPHRHRLVRHVYLQRLDAKRGKPTRQQLSCRTESFAKSCLAQFATPCKLHIVGKRLELAFPCSRVERYRADKVVRFGADNPSVWSQHAQHRAKRVEGSINVYQNRLTCHQVEGVNAQIDRQYVADGVFKRDRQVGERLASALRCRYPVTLAINAHHSRVARQHVREGLAPMTLAAAYIQYTHRSGPSKAACEQLEIVAVPPEIS